MDVGERHDAQRPLMRPFLRGERPFRDDQPKARLQPEGITPEPRGAREPSGNTQHELPARRTRRHRKHRRKHRAGSAKFGRH